ncbi:hypothetical protein [Actinacidiphila epipremni]|jgi:hypothetical protein|uniref:DUF2180 family protein n=1 Tax=Actinacidiphila epipremni TaxID=2053013 RepID=A0ABX0ZNL2_9ACTN|nr:hypothetical protein [Actinacidiphila epipremni]NJP45500.1 hypothetical protein [Actinacidiphila epipremni]
MKCLDCALANPVGTTTLAPPDAVAACAHCGAGVCGHHAHIAFEPVAGAPGDSPAARRVTCDVCHPAESAAGLG